MRPEWSAVIQSVVLAFCTWYVRRGSRKDKEAVIDCTSSEETSKEILKRLYWIESEFVVMKRAFSEMQKSQSKNLGLPNRGPNATN